ncbi:MAG: alpha/beta fold hydrolase [Verrucomicrobiota bacterium JB025]|nr:alpha/beta fold hydrolase [Verrucomicrobiota bacterium JB025]
MLRQSKHTDETRDAGQIELWSLHGAVGLAGDFRHLGKHLADRKISSRSVDLWRFLECCPMPLPEFGPAFNADAGNEAFRGSARALLGYSMGGRLALHALLENNHPWKAAVIVSAHPGLENDDERTARRASDARWATKALAGEWQTFLTDWNSQPTLAAAIERERGANGRLMMRRREIARSFVDWSLGTQQPLWDRLPEIHIPVLWIAGENDAKFLPLAERAASALPHGTLVTAKGAGHRIPWENPDWFHETVASFLLGGLPSQR